MCIMVACFSPKLSVNEILATYKECLFFFF